VISVAAAPTKPERVFDRWFAEARVTKAVNRVKIYLNARDFSENRVSPRTHLL
jgi:hypothetical protein